MPPRNLATGNGDIGPEKSCLEGEMAKLAPVSKITWNGLKELDDEMEKDLGYYIVDTTALMGDLKNLKTISRQS